MTVIKSHSGIISEVNMTGEIKRKPGRPKTGVAKTGAQRAKDSRDRKREREGRAERIVLKESQPIGLRVEGEVFKKIENEVKRLNYDNTNAFLRDVIDNYFKAKE
jgi:hypothetical protein